MNQEMKKYLMILGFNNCTSIPKMKEVRVQFLKRSLECHPDKPGGSDDKMKELLEAKKKVSEYIMKNVKEDTNDDEESLARKEFKDANMEIVNKKSVTFHVPTGHVMAWEEVLRIHFGFPSIDNSDTNNGKQFDTIEGYHIKIWKKSTEKSTVVVDGKEGYFNFATQRIPTPVV